MCLTMTETRLFNVIQSVILVQLSVSKVKPYPYGEIIFTLRYTIFHIYQMFFGEVFIYF